MKIIITYIVFTTGIMLTSCVPSHQYIVEGTSERITDADNLYGWIVAEELNCGRSVDNHYYGGFSYRDYNFKYEDSWVVESDPEVTKLPISHILFIIYSNDHNEYLTLYYTYNIIDDKWCYSSAHMFDQREL